MPLVSVACFITPHHSHAAIVVCEVRIGCLAKLQKKTPKSSIATSLCIPEVSSRSLVRLHISLPNTMHDRRSIPLLRIRRTARRMWLNGYMLRLAIFVWCRSFGTGAESVSPTKIAGSNVGASRQTVTGHPRWLSRTGTTQGTRSLNSRKEYIEYRIDSKYLFKIYKI